MSFVDNIVDHHDTFEDGDVRVAKNGSPEKRVLVKTKNLGKSDVANDFPTQEGASHSDRWRLVEEIAACIGNAIMAIASRVSALVRSAGGPADVSANRNARIRVGAQAFDQPAQSAANRFVVGVEKVEKFGFGCGDPDVARSAGVPEPRIQHRQAQIQLAGSRGRDVRCAVVRAVVDEQYLVNEVAIILQAADRCLDGRSRISRRNDYRNESGRLSENGLSLIAPVALATLALTIHRPVWSELDWLPPAAYLGAMSIRRRDSHSPDSYADSTEPARVGIRYLDCDSAGLRYKLAIESDESDEYHIGASTDWRWNHVQECLLLLVEPGDTVLDVGANIGVVTIPLAAKGARVIAYEVLGENVRFLEAGLRANRLEDRVTVRNVAAWESTVRLSFTGSSAWARVVPGGKPTHQAVEIDTDLSPTTNVTAVKLDVEGSEVHVLRGMSGLLKDQRPHIVFESNSLELGRIGSSTTDLFGILKRIGYRIYRLYDRRRLLRPRSCPQESGVADFLATSLNPWQLRRLGFRVGALQPRHIVRRILEWGDDRWPDHLHLLVVVDHLPARVVRDRRIAAMIDGWRERYRDHPQRHMIQAGVFGPPDRSPHPRPQAALQSE